MPLDNQAITSAKLREDPKPQNRGIRIARGTGSGKNVSTVVVQQLSPDEEASMIMAGLEQFANVPGTNGLAQFASRQASSQPISVDGGYVDEMGLPVRTSSYRGVAPQDGLSGIGAHMRQHAEADRNGDPGSGFAGAEGEDPSPEDRHDVGGDRSAELEEGATFRKPTPVPDQEDPEPIDFSREADGELSVWTSEPVDTTDRRDRSYQENPSVSDEPNDALMDIPENGDPASMPPKDFVGFGQPHIPGISQDYPAEPVKNTDIIGAKVFHLADGRSVVGKIQAQDQTTVLIVGKINGVGPTTRISKSRVDILKVEAFRQRASVRATSVSEAYSLYKKAKGTGERKAMKTIKGYECRLVDDGTMDTVVSCNGVQFRFDSEGVERLPDGTIPEDEMNRLFDESSEMYEEQKADDPQSSVANRRVAGGLPGPDAGWDLNDPVFAVGDQVTPDGNLADPYYGQTGTVSNRDTQISPNNTGNRAPEDIEYTVDFPGGGYSNYYFDGLKKVGSRKPVTRKAGIGEVYQALQAAGIPTDHHESDLYVKDTPEAQTILQQNGIQGQPFIDSIDHEPWLEISFGYPMGSTASRKPTVAAMKPENMSARDTMPEGGFYGSDSAMVDQLKLNEKRKADIELRLKTVIKAGNVADSMGDSVKAEKLSVQAETLYNNLQQTKKVIASMESDIARIRQRRTASCNQRFFKDNPPADKGAGNPFL